MGVSLSQRGWWPTFALCWQNVGNVRAHYRSCLSGWSLPMQHRPRFAHRGKDLIEGVDGKKALMDLINLDACVQHALHAEVHDLAPSREHVGALLVRGGHARAVDAHLTLLPNEAELEGVPVEPPHDLQLLFLHRMADAPVLRHGTGKSLVAEHRQ